jgi:superfamily I DNA/RNA helicase
MLDEQLTILELIETNNHVYFDGGAGTGKSFLLAQAARNIAKSGKKTLVTCWNYMMAEELASTLNRPGMTVTDLNTLMLQICGLDKNPDDAGTDWYENELPQLTIDALEKDPTLGGYEAICIDEFQDIAGNVHLLGVMVGLLRMVKLNEAKIILAGDRNQQIMRDGGQVVNPMTRAKTIIPDLVHVRLRTNCRTVPELAKRIPQVIDVDTDIVRHRIPEGFNGGLEIVQSSDEKQAQHLSTVIKRLLERYNPRDIVILSPFGEKNSTVGQLMQRGPKTADERGLVAQLETDSGEGKIRWRSMAKFKGLESPVVVITDVNDKAKEFATNTQKKLDELLYVGITRAKYECVLIGDAFADPNDNQ